MKNLNKLITIVQYFSSLDSIYESPFTIFDNYEDTEYMIRYKDNLYMKVLYNKTNRITLDTSEINILRLSTEPLYASINSKDIKIPSDDDERFQLYLNNPVLNTLMNVQVQKDTTIFVANYLIDEFYNRIINECSE